jgi:hypothetical protein
MIIAIGNYIAGDGKGGTGFGSNWVLASGDWNDLGVWVDTAVWID